MVDLDGDGIEDILSGSWPGDIYFFKATADRVFTAPTVLFHPPDDPKVPGYSILQSSAVSAADWDADGDIDLVVGNISGNICLLRNEGSPTEPKFQKAEMLSAGGKPIEVAGHKAGPCFADWDGDGLRDLVVGSEGGEIVCFRNTGSLRAPQFAAAEKVLPGEKEFKEGYRFKLCVADWNDDGLVDLLIGTCQSEPKDEHDVHGYVWVCLRERPEARPEERPAPGPRKR